jgi:hypothetical protein
MKRALALAALLFLPAGQGLAADRPQTGDPNAPLRMEELEVRGLREKPEVLYLPVQRGISLPSPVRFDLFLVDVSRPVTLQEIEPENPTARGNTEGRKAP